MRASTGKLYQRVTNIALAFMLVLTTVTASLPFLSSSDVSAVGPSAVVYDSLPSVVPDTNYPSLGYQATSTSEFGDYINLAGSNRMLETVTTTMSNWAKYSDYSSDARYLGDNTSWTHPVTVKVYSADGSANPDTLLASREQTVTIPWRPETPGYPFSGIAFNATFDLSDLNVLLPDDVIVSVEYNTQTHGPSPIGVTGPYNSLNVAVPTSQPVVVGSDVSVDTVYLDSSWSGVYSSAGATGVFRQDAGWTPYGTLALEITASVADNTKPNVNITSPLSGTTQPGTFSVEGTASDALSGIDRVDYSVTEISAIGGSFVANVQSGTASGTTSFNFGLAGLSDGFYRLKVQAFDVAGNWKYDYNDVEVDATKPNVNITSPLSGTTQPGTFSVEGTASDALSGLDRVDYSVTEISAIGGSYVANVTSGTATGTDNFSFNLAGLTDGFYRLKVQAFDVAGNWKYDYNDVEVDATKPFVNITSPASGSLLNSSSVAVEGTASDALSGLDRVDYSVTEISAIGGSYVANVETGTATGTTSFNFGLAGLSDGFYRIKVQAFDAVGNWKYDYNDVQIDTTAPTDPEITSPITNDVFGGASTLNEWTASTDDNGIAQYEVQYVLSTGTVYRYEAGTSRVQTFTGAYQGPITISVRAQDNAGNWSNWSDEVTYYYDTVAPLITMNDISDFMTTSVVTVSGTASDDESGLRNDEIRLSFRPIVGSVLQAPEKTYTVTVDGSGNWTIDVNTADLTEGQLYRVVARANDNLGTSYATSNTAAATDDTTVDTLAPLVTIDPLTIAGNTPTITGLVNDPTAEVFLSIDGGAPFLVTNNGTTWEYTFTTPVLDGDYALVVVAFDEAGNLSDSATAIMTIDTTVPATEEEETVTPAGAVTPTPAAAPAIAPFGVLGATTDNEAAASTTNDDETGVEGVSTETAAAIDTDASDDGTILGIAWYWWLLLIAALAAIAGWIIAAIRRRQAEQE